MKRSPFLVILIIVIFFVISFLTNILGPIIPDIIASFSLSLKLAGFLPFSFFVAYGVMSIPAGMMAEKYSSKAVMVAAFTLAAVGAFAFALFPAFNVALPSLFSIGIGMAMLQVVINPLLRQAGGDQQFAFNSVLAQFFFGLASFLSPKLYTYLVTHLFASDATGLISMIEPLVSPQLKWVSIYWIFGAIALAMVVIIALIRFPSLQLRDDEKIQTGAAFQTLLRNKYVILYFIGIFAYVGTEQGIANWISKFLQQYHGVDPAKTGADVVANFWGLLTIGCLLGLALLKFIDSRKVLVFFSMGCMASLLIALLGSREAAIVAFPASGFFASVMWSVIIALALNSVAAYHGTFSGILCTGIVGGAVVPLIIGSLADAFELRYAMCFLFITLAYIFSIGWWAKPIVSNIPSTTKLN